MVYGYARCSTNEERQDIDRQIRELMEKGVPREAIYMEYESGTKEDRPEWLKLLAQIGEGDVLMATEISRFTRSTKQLCEILDFCREKHLRLEIGSFIVDCRENEMDPMTEGMLKMMGVFAELERNMTVSRIKSGLANARAKGRTLGRPEVTAADLPSTFYKHYHSYQKGQISKTDLARLCQVSRDTIYRWIALAEADGEQKAKKSKV